MVGIDLDQVPLKAEELAFVNSLLHVDKVRFNVPPILKVLEQEEMFEEILHLYFGDLSFLECQLDSEDKVEERNQLRFKGGGHNTIDLGNELS